MKFYAANTAEHYNFVKVQYPWYAAAKNERACSEHDRRRDEHVPVIGGRKQGYTVGGVAHPMVASIISSGFAFRASRQPKEVLNPGDARRLCYLTAMSRGCNLHGLWKATV